MIFYFSGCLLHVLASFPQSTKSEKIKSTISSCVILTEDHMKFLSQQTISNKSEVITISEGESRKSSRRKNKENASDSSSSENIQKSYPKKVKSPREGNVLFVTMSYSSA